MQKGFGAFSYAFPIGVDAGIVVLLSLDLVLTWLRIPFPLLRQTAWLLTAATIAFNAAASWGDALGMAMHAVIPVLFVVVVEASRHAVGLIAAITADRHMESVRLMRWLLSPVPTFRLWRRMKLWELRSYDETVRLEQNRLVYRAQLRFRYGRGWRRSAPFQALLPLKLAKYGVPLDPSILDRIDGPLDVTKGEAVAAVAPAAAAVSAAVAVPTLAKLAAVRLRDAQEQPSDGVPVTEPEAAELNVWMTKAVRGYSQPSGEPESHGARVPGQVSPWFKPPRATAPRGAEVPVQAGRQQPAPAVAGTGAAQARPVQARPRQAGPAQAGVRQPAAGQAAAGRMGRPVRLEQTFESELPDEEPRPVPQAYREQPAGTGRAVRAGGGEPGAEPLPIDVLDAEMEAALEAVAEQSAQTAARRPSGDVLDADVCFDALIEYIDTYGQQPDPQSLAEFLTTEYGVSGTRSDGSVNPADLARIWSQLENRYVISGRE